MNEQNAAVGYAAIKKESTVGTPVTPNVYTPYYSQSVMTDFHLMEDTPVYGNRFKRFQHLKGTRSHGGNITVMAEPNTIGYWLDMLLNKSGTTGSDPYTHTFGLSNTDTPNSYTMDLSFGSQVVRFWGVQASNINFAWEDQKMQLEIDVSGLGSLYGREIASVSDTEITLKTQYDSNPTKGFVASDLVKLTTVDGSTTLNTTISSVDDETTLTLGASASSFSAGDMIVLRPATPSLSVLTPFLWGKTHFFFAASASAAVTASADTANQTRLESGTELSLAWEFEDNEGSKRSGGFDPASLVRTVGDYSFGIKKFFDTPDDIQNWNALEKQSVLVVAYSGDSNEYALKVTLNNMTQRTEDIPTESGGTVYEEIEMGGNYDQSDGQGFSVQVINAVSTV